MSEILHGRGSLLLLWLICVHQEVSELNMIITTRRKWVTWFFQGQITGKSIFRSWRRFISWTENTLPRRMVKQLKTRDVSHCTSLKTSRQLFQRSFSNCLGMPLEVEHQCLAVDNTSWSYWGIRVQNVGVAVFVRMRRKVNFFFV